MCSVPDKPLYLTSGKMCHRTADTNLANKLQLSQLELPKGIYFAETSGSKVRDTISEKGQTCGDYFFLSPQFFQPFSFLSPFLCQSVMSAVPMALICGYYGVLGCELSH